MTNYFPGSPLPGSTFMADLQLILGDEVPQGMPSVPRNIAAANGGMEVWQRGTSISVAASNSPGTYANDRWYLLTGANQAHTVSAVTGLVSGSKLAAQVQRTAGQTGTTQMLYACPLDTDELIKMAGQKVMIIFRCATGANWSPSSGTLIASLVTGTGASPSKSAGFSGSAVPLSQSFNIAAGSSSAFFQTALSTAIAAGITQAEVQFAWTPVGTAGANDWFQVDDVQLQIVTANLTSITPVFERRNFKADYDDCQRFYYKTFPYATAPAQNAGNTGAVSATLFTNSGTLVWDFRYPVELRAVPSITFYNPGASNGNWRNISILADSGAGVASRSTAKGFALADTLTGSDTSTNIVLVHLAADSSI